MNKPALAAALPPITVGVGLLLMVLLNHIPVGFGYLIIDMSGVQLSVGELVAIILSIIAIVEAVIFYRLTARFDRHTHTLLNAITVTQIYEKTAMMYSYAADVAVWPSKSQEWREATFRRIEADLLALQDLEMNDDQKRHLRAAFGMLAERMGKEYAEPLAVQIRPAFTSLNLD